MRFENYLIENLDDERRQQEVIEVLRRDCKPFLDFCKKNDILFKREVINVDYSKHSYFKKTTRKDRKALDTPQFLSDLIDDAFYKKFKWKPRSEGVFTLPVDVDSAIGYYLFFPIGKFKFITSPNVSDLYVSLGIILNELLQKRLIKDFKYIKLITPDEAELIAKTFLSNKFKYFTDKVNKKAFEHKNETVFKCDSYYLVRSWTFENTKILENL